MAVVTLFPSSVSFTPSANSASFKSLVTTIAAFGTPEQLTALAIPAGVALSVTADKSNTGLIYVADSSANALDATKRIELRPGESTALYVSNRNAVWVDSSIASQKVLSVVEST
jgi:hypothetical protein